MKFAPQQGPQTRFLSSSADIAIYGGAAGGGKSFALLLEPLRNLYTKNFEAVIFRRVSTQIKNPGGLWDESQQIYPHLGAVPREGSFLDWHVPGGLTLKFAHMQHVKNMYDWQGAQIGFAGFDELTHFARRQFFYIISRLRSMTGVPGYIRATCNPDADSWVAEFIAWWIDQDSGFPIPERDGVLRYFVRQGDDLIWGDSREELMDEFGEEIGSKALSVTFIAAKIMDNQILLEKDPQYLANLNALDRVERARLKDGNWKIRASAGEFFKRSDFQIIETLPPVVRWIRYWDRAATKPSNTSKNPDWTVGVKMGMTPQKQLVIAHVERFRDGPLGVERRLKNVAAQDGKGPTIGIEQDPGQAGKVEAESWTRTLMGWDVRLFPVHKDKKTRARGYSAQVEAGNVLLLKGDWNDTFLDEHENFPPSEDTAKENEETRGKDDQVDAASGAFNFLTGDKVGTWVQPTGKAESKTIASGFTRGIPEW